MKVCFMIPDSLEKLLVGCVKMVQLARHISRDLSPCFRCLEENVIPASLGRLTKFEKNGWIC